MENYLFYVSASATLNAEERRTNRISFLRLLDRYAENRIMLNNAPEIDPSIWESIPTDDENGEPVEVYQWLACHLDDYDVKALNHFGIITAYSEILDCDLIAVTHFGTAWDYVMTCAEPTDDFSAAWKPYND